MPTEKQKPLISIITVTYNAAQVLAPTLQSISMQQDVLPGTDFEVIVMDGASSDGTPQLARQIAPPACTVYSEPDNGIYHAMNRAMDRANGTYFMFLNAGDSLHSPHTLSQIVNAIRENNFPGVIYGQTHLVDSERNFIAQRHLTAPPRLNSKSFRDGMLVCHQAFIALARIAPRYNMSYRYSADFDWCIQILQHSRNNIFLNHTIVDYLAEGTTTANRFASLRERFRIMCYYYGTIPTIIRHLKFIPRFIKNK